MHRIPSSCSACYSSNGSGVAKNESFCPLGNASMPAFPIVLVIAAFPTAHPSHAPHSNPTEGAARWKALPSFANFAKAVFKIPISR